MESDELFEGCVVLGEADSLREATADLPATSGVCLLTDGSDQPILLLYGSGLRRLVRGRLAEAQAGERTRKTRLRPIVRRVWFRRTWSTFETQLYYYRLARAVYPERYEEFFGGLEVYFVGVDLGARYPLFEVTGQLRGGQVRQWGPFATRRSARAYLAALQDIFDLCRCGEVLALAPQGTACAYASMGRCAAVACDGRADVVSYRAVVESAVAFLDRPLVESLGQLEGAMQGFAAELAFEQAERVKRQLASAKKLAGSAYRWVRPLESFSVLAVQRGPKVRRAGQRGWVATAACFVVGPGWVESLSPFLVAEAAEAAGQILDHVNLGQWQAAQGGRERSRELLAWGASLLYSKGRRGEGLYVPLEASLTAERLAEAIRGYFSVGQDSGEAER